MSTTSLTWTFPILRPHAGALLGNGTQGLMVWGDQAALHITIGRSGFWDHRWGNDFTAGITYKGLEALLQAGDEDGLRQAFNRLGEDHPDKRPHQLGAGRLTLAAPQGWHWQEVELCLDKAQVLVLAVSDTGDRAQLLLDQAVEHECFRMQFPEVWTAACDCQLQPVWNFIADQLQPLGCQAAEVFAVANGQGFVQELPEDDPLACAFVQDDSSLLCATALGPDARQQVVDCLALKDAFAGHEAWWRDYWHSVPTVTLDDPVLQELLEYGLFKQACATPPHGLACTLQGPFLEDYQIPPWSCDYHFNINIQMIYWPCLASGRSDHLRPVWEMIRKWSPALLRQAKQFFEADDAFMLPHAVDDRCQVVGNFWTGSIDHACTAWMAQLAWLHYRYSGDREVLQQDAWPLLRGAFNGYWAMLETEGEAGLRLPVSVSPEFRGCEMDAWGGNASFQLAALHMLVSILPQAAAELGEDKDPRWARVSAELPPYATVTGPRTREQARGPQDERIGLWDGQDLIDSHRHHSHLAAIYPFCTIDPLDGEHAQIVAASLYHWVRMGAGAWSGWCVPWASIINARVDRSDAAISWLHWWAENFVNEGRGTLHDSAFPGPSSLASPGPWTKRQGERNREVMQLDAGFGALNAIFELLVQQRQDAIHVLPGLSHRWRELHFDGIHCEGGFVIGATVVAGSVQEVRVRAQRAGTLRLQHGLGESAQCAAQSVPECLVAEMQAGETLTVVAG